MPVCEYKEISIINGKKRIKNLIKENFKIPTPSNIKFKENCHKDCFPGPFCRRRRNALGSDPFKTGKLKICCCSKFVDDTSHTIVFLNLNK
jgi:hypothetical protein